MANDDMLSLEDLVGYGKPPKHKQFKKGKSGNPKGRPPDRILYQIMQDVMNEEIIINKEGEKVKMTKKEVMVQQLMRDSMNGKSAATKNVILLLRMLPYLPPF